jgi:hypothetical protein
MRIIRRGVFCVAVVIGMPIIAATSLLKNIRDALQYWWLDMRCNVCDIPRLWRGL